jgi:hypothetical protein
MQRTCYTWNRRWHYYFPKQENTGKNQQNELLTWAWGLLATNLEKPLQGSEKLNANAHLIYFTAAYNESQNKLKPVGAH